MMDSNSVKIDIDGENSSVCKEVKISDDVEPSKKERQGYKTESFMKEYKQPDLEPLSTREKCKGFLKKLSNSSNCNKRKALSKLLPIFKIYRKYKIKTDLPNDAISGFTVGIMQLPQGMAYAMLADLPPVVGLYMSFFPVLIYFLLGTSRHISMGTGAVISLMIGSIVSKVTTPNLSSRTISPVNIPSTTPDSLWNITKNDTSQHGSPVSSSVMSDLEMQKIALASTMGLMVGVVQVIFGVCRLGFVTTYMSGPLVSGFTTGAAVHVFTSQVKYIFGLKIPRFPNLLHIVYSYQAIIANLPNTNIPTLTASAICLLILYIVKVQINYRFKNRMKIPIPIELIVIIIATILSYFLQIKDTYGFKVIDKIPAGFPPFSPPSLSGTSQYFSDAIIVGVVAFAQSVSLATLIAQKHQYTIDSNQEFIAYGAGNIFGSFFSCYPFVAALSRSSVQDSAGGRTQIASLLSAALVLVVILGIGPLFESLPNCVLASIIVVALRPMFYQIFELQKLWKVSIYDFLIWIVTFLAVVILYVDLGLWIGLIFSFLTVIFRSQLTKPVTIQKIPATNTYANNKKYVKTESEPGIIVVSFNSPIYYANADIFVKQVYKISKLYPDKCRRKIKKLTALRKMSANEQPNMDSNGCHQNNMESISSLDSFGIRTTGCVEMSFRNKENNEYIHHIIVDCSAICFIDTVGGNVMKQLCDEYKTIGIKVLLAAVKDDVWRVLEKTGFLDEYREDVYLTVPDAVAASTEEPESSKEPQYITRL